MTATNINPTNYQFLVLRKAIKIYLETGHKVNRDYTPAGMLRTATYFTGIEYTRGQLKLAQKDLDYIYSRVYS